jgi:hypothetical protein
MTREQRIFKDVFVCLDDSEVLQKAKETGAYNEIISMPGTGAAIVIDGQNMNQYIFTKFTKPGDSGYTYIRVFNNPDSFKQIAGQIIDRLNTRPDRIPGICFN